MPPHTTKRRTTTNLKTKNNQNCQKIELYGSLTTKELKKKHSSRLVGGVERTCGKVDGWWTGWSHICRQINLEEQLGSVTDCSIKGYSAGNEDSKPLTEKICEDCSGGINSQPHRRVRWRDPQGPRMYTNPSTQESAPEKPNLLVGSGGSD